MCHRLADFCLVGIVAIRFNGDYATQTPVDKSNGLILAVLGVFILVSLDVRKLFPIRIAAADHLASRMLFLLVDTRQRCPNISSALIAISHQLMRLPLKI